MCAHAGDHVLGVEGRDPTKAFVSLHFIDILNTSKRVVQCRNACLGYCSNEVRGEGLV